jgi:hypothetical protein
MRNCDYYKTPQELSEACKTFCAPMKTCSECEFYEREDIKCETRFAYAEHAEHAEPKKTKRRPYTFDEACALRGKAVFCLAENGRMYGTICTITEGKEENLIYIGGYKQSWYIDHNATIDGEPFGVEVAE